MFLSWSRCSALVLKMHVFMLVSLFSFNAKEAKWVDEFFLNT